MSFVGSGADSTESRAFAIDEEATGDETSVDWNLVDLCGTDKAAPVEVAMLADNKVDDKVKAADVSKGLKDIDKLEVESGPVVFNIAKGIREQHDAGGMKQVQKWVDEVNAGLKGSGKEMKVSEDPRVTKAIEDAAKRAGLPPPEKVLVVQLYKDGKPAGEGIALPIWPKK